MVPSDLIVMGIVFENFKQCYALPCVSLPVILFLEMWIEMKLDDMNQMLLSTTGELILQDC